VVEAGAAARIARSVPAGLGSVLLGLVVGVLGGFHHATEVNLAGFALPVGLALALLALVLAQLLAGAALAVVGPMLVLLGWLMAAVVLGSSRPEGDLAVPAGAAGEGFLYGGFVLGLAAAMVLTLGARRATGTASSSR
jgi:hypothetical protein